MVFVISGLFFPPSTSLSGIHSLVCAAPPATLRLDLGPGLGLISALLSEPPQQPSFSCHLQALAYFSPWSLLVFLSSAKLTRSVFHRVLPSPSDSAIFLHMDHSVIFPAELH